MTNSNLYNYQKDNDLTLNYTYSFHKYMNQFSYTTQSVSEKINNYKQISGYTSSYTLEPFTNSSTFSKPFEFSGATNSNISNLHLTNFFNNNNTLLSFNNSIGTYSYKFFTKVTHNIRKLDKKPLMDIVSIINSISLDSAKKLILDDEITVNGVLITDIDYELKSLDIIRIGLEGHFINNPNGIAIIK